MSESNPKSPVTEEFLREQKDKLLPGYYQRLFRQLYEMKLLPKWPFKDKTLDGYWGINDGTGGSKGGH